MAKKHSDETKQKMRNKAKQRKPFSEQRKKEISERMCNNNPFKGKNHSEESKRKMSLSHKNIAKKRCPVCNKEVTPSVYGRWHGNRCKSRGVN